MARAEHLAATTPPPCNPVRQPRGQPSQRIRPAFPPEADVHARSLPLLWPFSCRHTIHPLPASFPGQHPSLIPSIEAPPARFGSASGLWASS